MSKPVLFTELKKLESEVARLKALTESETNKLIDTDRQTKAELEKQIGEIKALLDGIGDRFTPPLTDAGDLMTYSNGKVSRLPAGSRGYSPVSNKKDVSGLTYVPGPMIALNSMMMSLPGLRGLWAGSVNASGNWVDISGNGNHLTHSGSHKIAEGSDGLYSYWDLSGSGDYFTVADSGAAGPFDILGTETKYLTPGLTFYMWLSSDDVTHASGFGKWSITPNDKAYVLSPQSSKIVFAVSNSGTATDGQADSDTITNGVRYFVCGRFVPSTSVDIFIGSAATGLVKSSDTSSVPASLNDSAQPFDVGRLNGSSSFDFNGKIFAPAALYASAHSDACVESIFRTGRFLLGI